MPFSEDQLDIWAKQGPTQQFVDTYNSIRSVLVDQRSPFYKRDFDVHLQGSYGNDTNIRGDSDVDVVICTADTYGYDLGHLPPDQKALYQQQNVDVQTAFYGFKQEVISWLNDNYGAVSVVPGKKAILLKGNDYRRDADILVATEHRQYFRYQNASKQGQGYHQGIRFYTSDGQAIENFPKEHSKDCTSKHQATNSWFKPTVRIFKNMRNRMIEKGVIKDGLAPSYFIEGALWNVPNEKFGGTFQSTVGDCLNWLHASNRQNLLCANQLRFLLRDGYPDCWKPANFEAFLASAIIFWNNGAQQQ
jgi:hypothetical protein